MDDQLRVRLANPGRDAAAAAAIYRPAIEETIASFEIEAPGEAAMRQRMETILARTPWLVAERDGEVVGYAYAGPHQERAGYAWSVNVSVYVRPDQQRRGVGRALYRALFGIVRDQGFVNACAGIGLPNEASERLHESFGMRRLGVYHRIGWKHGAWIDVAWFELRLAEPVGEPAPPTPLPDLLATPDGRAAVEHHLASRD